MALATSPLATHEERRDLPPRLERLDTFADQRRQRSVADGELFEYRSRHYSDAQPSDDRLCEQGLVALLRGEATRRFCELGGDVAGRCVVPRLLASALELVHEQAR